MTDLGSLKVAMFDFDGTLAVHKDSDYLQKRNKSEDARLRYYLDAYLNPEDFYEVIEPCASSENLYNFIVRLREKGVKMYCLSGMSFSFHLKAKQCFVNKHYGDDIEVISTASQKLKLDGMKIIQKMCGCELDEMLFVDDLEDTIRYLRDNGVRAVNVNALISISES